MDYFEQYM